MPKAAEGIPAASMALPSFPHAHDPITITAMYVIHQKGEGWSTR